MHKAKACEPRQLQLHAKCLKASRANKNHFHDPRDTRTIQIVHGSCLLFEWQKRYPFIHILEMGDCSDDIERYSGETVVQYILLYEKICAKTVTDGLAHNDEDKQFHMEGTFSAC